MKHRSYIEQDDSDWDYSETSRAFTPGTPYRDRYQRMYVPDRSGELLSYPVVRE